jgi:hypothetical protein
MLVSEISIFFDKFGVFVSRVHEGEGMFPVSSKGRQ